MRVCVCMYVYVWPQMQNVKVGQGWRQEGAKKCDLYWTLETLLRRKNASDLQIAKPLLSSFYRATRAPANAHACAVWIDIDVDVSIDEIYRERE